MSTLTEFIYVFNKLIMHAHIEELSNITMFILIANLAWCRVDRPWRK